MLEIIAKYVVKLFFFFFTNVSLSFTLAFLIQNVIDKINICQFPLL